METYDLATRSGFSAFAAIHGDKLARSARFMLSYGTGWPSSERDRAVKAARIAVSPDWVYSDGLCSVMFSRAVRAGIVFG